MKYNMKYYKWAATNILSETPYLFPSFIRKARDVINESPLNWSFFAEHNQNKAEQYYKKQKNQTWKLTTI